MQETQETRVRSLGWEDPLEEEMATHSSILAWKNPRDIGAWQATVYGDKKSWTQLNIHAERRVGRKKKQRGRFIFISALVFILYSRIPALPIYRIQELFH